MSKIIIKMMTEQEFNNSQIEDYIANDSLRKSKRNQFILLISGLLTLIGSYFLIVTFFQSKKIDKPTKVMGENDSVEKDSSDSASEVVVGWDRQRLNKTLSEGVNFSDVSKNNQDAPKKKAGYGSYYVGAKSSVVIDVASGEILHYQDGRKRAAIASLTKMMTAILVAEKIPDWENEIVTIDEEAVRADGTKIGCPRSGYCISNRLRVGEKISVKSLMQALLMNSANDAAIALGKHIAGSQAEFAKLMNKKAADLSLADTHFCNPSGLDDDANPGACYSSAYDLALISRYSLKYDKIWEIMRQREKDVYSADGQIVHHIINTNVLLDQMPNCLGSKTGFTYEAGKSLMMSAYKLDNKNVKAIAVILDDEYRWEHVKNLFNWVFDAYEWE